MAAKRASAKSGKKKCEARTELCSGQLVTTYGVNGPEKKGLTFRICGPCRVYLERTSKLKQIRSWLWSEAPWPPKGQKGK